MFTSFLRLSCPNCHRGRLYKSYLKQVDVCAECDVEWGKYRADDGPAWLTILVLGHILVPLSVYAAMETSYEVWQIMMVVCGLAVVLVLALLPYSKALFLTILWRSNAGV